MVNDLQSTIPAQDDKQLGSNSDPACVEDPSLQLARDRRQVIRMLGESVELHNSQEGSGWLWRLGMRDRNGGFGDDDGNILI